MRTGRELRRSVPLTALVASPQDERFAFSSGRLLLTHLGYLSPDSRERVTPLAASESFLAKLDQLDAAPSRVCATVPVMFARDASATVHALLYGVEPKDAAAVSAAVSADFVAFLGALGWPVDLATHPGFCGPLPRDAGLVAPYFADMNREVIFASPALLNLEPSGRGLQGTVAFGL